MSLNQKGQAKALRGNRIFPASPEVFLLLTSILCFVAWARGERISSRFGLYGWRFNVEYMIKCQVLIAIIYFGYLVGKSHLFESKPKRSIKSLEWDFSKVHNIGVKFTLIGLMSHFVWFSYSIFILKTPFGYKLTTIPGVTTFTQILPLGLACLYLAKKMKGSRTWYRWYAISIIVVGARTILNAERLALLELMFPIVVIFLYFLEYRSLKRRLAQLFIGALSGYLFFFLLEYIRSWQFHKFRWNGNYLSFINDRISLYYITSWNNGAIYSQYWNEGEGNNRIFFSMFTQMPLIRQLIAADSNQILKNNSWHSTLDSTVGTAEFNNANYLIVSFSDLSFVGAMFWFMIVGIILGLIVRNIRKGSLMALIAYATTAIALVELPRIGLWTSTRIVPIYLGLSIIYFSRLVSIRPRQHGNR